MQDALLKSEALLREQSVRDHLTGVFNRRYMEETLERELLRASRKELLLGIIMLDLDDFKRFNDTYGHAAGDAILRDVGSLLLEHVARRTFRPAMVAMSSLLSCPTPRESNHRAG